MTWLLPMFQGFIFALLIGRVVEGPQPFRYALWGAVAFPIASWILAKFAPRSSIALWLLMVAFWGGACGYSAFEDPSLQAWEWILVFTVSGIVFGACANYPLVLSQDLATTAQVPVELDSTRSAEPSANATNPDPWEILDLSPSASQSDIKRAYFTLMQKYHPGEAGTAELRRLAEDATRQIKWAYDAVRSNRT